MRTIAHISDLHFGSIREDAEEALLNDLKAMKPSLIAVSGDLTQRALRRQFKRAREYLERLPSPFIVVPGNHDIPLFDVTRRFLLPLYRYKNYISTHLNPLYVDNEIAVLGVNTARSMKLENGKITKRQLEQAERIFAGLHRPLFKIIVTHHSFLMPPGAEYSKYRKPVGGAGEALQSFGRSGVEMILSGHFHRSYSHDVRESFPDVRKSIVNVQAGAAIAKHTVLEPNCYNFITVSPKSIRIEVRSCENGVFRPSSVVEYVRSRGQWIRKPG